MKLKSFIVIILASLVLVACGANEDNAFKENEGKNIKELVNDYSLRNIKDQSASITSHELIATHGMEIRQPMTCQKMNFSFPLLLILTKLILDKFIT